MRQSVAAAALAIALAAVQTVLVAQGSDVARLQGDPAVAAALRLVRKSEPETIAAQIRFCETPAPPFGEQARAELLRRAFVQIGLRNVRIDSEGNVLGERPGAAPRPHLVVSSHLDTVFPPGTELRVRRTGSTLRSPGIGDNCRGLAVLVAVARALRDAGVQTHGTVTFVANVGEEGLGDLRGMKALFGVPEPGRVAQVPPLPPIDRFVAVDGPGISVTNVAVGSHRYRVTFKGPGGHSFGSFGTASPIGALGRAVAKIAELEVPNTPVTTFNVGRIGGGTSVNAIPAESWMEVDLRSSDPRALASLDARFLAVLEAAVVEENARWGRSGQVTVAHERVGDRPAGVTPVDSAIVRTALTAARALGVDAVLSEGSTDANIPISLGIPAITIGAGGQGGDAHALTEWFDETESWKGTQHVLLVTVALSQR